jgi:hypothetical protein
MEIITRPISALARWHSIERTNKKKANNNFDIHVIFSPPAPLPKLAPSKKASI